MSSSRDFEDLE
jgi:hypothetical protein